MATHPIGVEIFQYGPNWWTDQQYHPRAMSQSESEDLVHQVKLLQQNTKTCGAAWKNSSHFHRQADRNMLNKLHNHPEECDANFWRGRIQTHTSCLYIKKAETDVHSASVYHHTNGGGGSGGVYCVWVYVSAFLETAWKDWVDSKHSNSFSTKRTTDTTWEKTIQLTVFLWNIMPYTYWMSELLISFFFGWFICWLPNNQRKKAGNTFLKSIETGCDIYRN